MSKKPLPAHRSILVLHGPNLNLLGTREPHLYGREALEDINRRLARAAKSAKVAIRCLQSNHEGELVDAVHRAKKQGVDFIILNPAGLTHTSVVLRDAMLAVGIPFIEVHLSNVHAREPWRRHSYFSDIAVGSIVGLGSRVYDLALRHALGLP